LQVVNLIMKYIAKLDQTMMVRLHHYFIFVTKPKIIKNGKINF